MRSHHFPSLELVGFMSGALGGLVGSVAFMGILGLLVQLFPTDPQAIFQDFRPHLLALAITALVVGPLAALGTSKGLAQAAGEQGQVRPKSFVLLSRCWVVALPSSILLGAMWVGQTSETWRVVVVPSVLCALAMVGVANIKRHA